VIAYQAAISQEEQFDSFETGGWGGPFGLGDWGNTGVTTSTIDVGEPEAIGKATSAVAGQLRQPS
jgi:hypothetical protein